MMEHEELEQQVRQIAQARIGIQEAVGRYVVGNHDLVDLILIGVLTGGHVLIDGVPGTAKTTISKIIARLIGYQFNRVQGAVDVQPADILGVRIYDAERHEFVLQKGPIFANFVM
ncbi:MAG: AAA family ATPase, partial [Methanospirillum sp.]